MAFNVQITGLDGVKRLLNNMEHHLPGLKHRTLQEFGIRMKRYAKENIKSIFPKRDGSENLKAHILRATGRDFVTVGAYTSYAGYVEYGTKPSSKNYPRYVKIGNKWVYMRSHPGAQGYPSQFFFSRAFNRVVGEAKDIVKYQMDKYIKEVNR